MALRDSPVGNWTLPNHRCSGKDGANVEKLLGSSGKFTVYFISLIFFRLIVSLAAAALLLLRIPLTQLGVQIYCVSHK